MDAGGSKNPDTPSSKRQKTGESGYTTPGRRNKFSKSDECRDYIAGLIIKKGYPIHLVEEPDFMGLVKQLQPRFEQMTSSAVEDYYVETYRRVKATVETLIADTPGRIGLSIDMWTSRQDTGYLFITGHFTDRGWNVHRKLLKVVMEPYPESDSALSHAVTSCVTGWDLKGKLLSLTTNRPLSQTAVNTLRTFLPQRNSDILGGQLLLRTCFAHVLRDIAQALLNSGQAVVRRVRDCVRSLKTGDILPFQMGTPVRAAAESLSLDDITQWDSTYNMLRAALQSKAVFSSHDILDEGSAEVPSAGVWESAEKLCEQMRPFFEAAERLASPSVQTTTSLIFVEALGINARLKRAAASSVGEEAAVTKRIQEIFDEFWGKSCHVLGMGVAMDARYKTVMVEWSSKEFYADEAQAKSYADTVKGGIEELLNQYGKMALPVAPTPGESSVGFGLAKFYASHAKESQASKAELDLYLRDSILPGSGDYDAVGYWKQNEGKYPTLSRMAVDILTLPVSTAVREQVFCMSGREMDAERCRLSPETVEALYCAKDWLARA